MRPATLKWGAGASALAQPDGMDSLHGENEHHCLEFSDVFTQSRAWFGGTPILLLNSSANKEELPCPLWKLSLTKEAQKLLGNFLIQGP